MTTQDLINHIKENGATYVKLNNNIDDYYLCDQDVDPGFILYINSYHVSDFDKSSYVLNYLFLPELYEYNLRKAAHVYRDKRNDYTLNVWEFKYKNKNPEKDIIASKLYVEKHYENWFSIMSDEQIDKIIHKRNDDQFILFLENQYPQFMSVLWDDYKNNIYEYLNNE